MTETACVGWTDQHDCVLDGAHAGDHRCVCGDVWNRDEQIDAEDERGEWDHLRAGRGLTCAPTEVPC